MSLHLQRGKLLLEQNRVSEAVKELELALADNPQDSDAMALLANCFTIQKKHKEAVQMINNAIRIRPDDAFLFYIKAHALLFSNEVRAAESATDQALQLYPFFAEIYEIKALIAFHDEQPEQALEFANKGLSIDSENVDLVNIRAQALVKLKRNTEAQETLDYALNRAPENAHSHANKGWTEIEQGKYDDALKSFQESLRLDPTSDWAQSGLKESIKAKNIFYRGILKYFLWMNKLSQKNQWAFIIGFYLLYQGLIWLSDVVPALSPILMPLILFYMLFAFSTWMARPLSNLFLRFHPLGKLALSDDEKMASNLVGLLLVSGLSSLVLFYFNGHRVWFEDRSLMVSENGETLFFLTIVLLFSTIPIGGMFNTEKGTTNRRNQMIFSISLVAVGIAGILLGIDFFFLIFFLGVFFYSFVSNYLTMKAAKRF